MEGIRPWDSDSPWVTGVMCAGVRQGQLYLHLVVGTWLQTSDFTQHRASDMARGPASSGSVLAMHRAPVALLLSASP